MSLNLSETSVGVGNNQELGVIIIVALGFRCVSISFSWFSSQFLVTGGITHVWAGDF